uniref:Uncharacterized protein n=1 Tax=Chromera velia CCMP2878 TaxID=1169474 RepID=A0A0G4F3B9_9ALVE|eukprot:Cvel_14748.t1-p1 / transcript=Cvel_14748.t1 / gene=Cvel_14748 / organism=Chromera_velia_CCMP2878 / gene_product=hypothetical protein / transcript_product=hypothetical protein / location=Cvel_scaffold1061:9615-11209(+) / protein_length=131 / sequence_SO=supercontig / SO=protein_coding / is_pseudo=false
MVPRRALLFNETKRSPLIVQQSYFDQDYGKKPLLKIKKVKILPNVRSYVSNVQCEKVKFGPSAAQQRESCGKCVKKTIYGKANEHYEECEAYRRLNGHVSWTAWMHMVQKKLDGGMTPQEYYEGPQDDYEY